MFLKLNPVEVDHTLSETEWARGTSPRGRAEDAVKFESCSTSSDCAVSVILDLTKLDLYVYFYNTGYWKCDIIHKT